MKKIVFLDFDGVINTPWINENLEWDIGGASKGFVSNKQALRLINKLFKETGGFEIATCTTWNSGRTREEMAKILVESGLDPSIPILEPVRQTVWNEKDGRGQSIIEYLNSSSHKKVEFIILDDDCDFDIMYKKQNLLDRLVQTSSDIGFSYKDYLKAEAMLGLKPSRRTLPRYNSKKNKR